MCKSHIVQGICNSWQRQWSRCSKATDLHQLHPSILNTKYRSTCPCPEEIRLLRLKSGFPLLNTELYKYKFVDSPLCPCGQAEESIHHLFIDCPHYTEDCDLLVSKIEQGYHNTQTATYLHCINTKVLLGACTDFNPRIGSIVTEAVSSILRDISRQF